MRRLSITARAQNSKERGGAFTFTILAASMVLLAVGGSFMTPARHTLTMNGVQQYKLVSKTLAESGLDWALSQDLSKAQTQSLELSSGKVEVTIKPQNKGALVECVSEPTKVRHKAPFRYKLTASISSAGGKKTVTSAKRSYTKSEDEKTDKDKSKKEKKKF